MAFTSEKGVRPCGLLRTAAPALTTLHAAAVSVDLGYHVVGERVSETAYARAVGAAIGAGGIGAAGIAGASDTDLGAPGRVGAEATFVLEPEALRGAAGFGAAAATSAAVHKAARSMLKGRSHHHGGGGGGTEPMHRPRAETVREAPVGARRCVYTSHSRV